MEEAPSFMGKDWSFADGNRAIAPRLTVSGYPGWVAYHVNCGTVEHRFEMGHF